MENLDHDAAHHRWVACVKGIFPRHGTKLHPAGAAIKGRPREVGAEIGTHARRTTSFTRDLDIAEVSVVEVAGEFPVLVGPGNDRAGEGERECQEDSKKHSVVHVVELVNCWDSTDI